MLTSLQAPPSWRRLAFISDLHLGPETPATLAAFEAWLGREPADALFILGDFFEAWVGDDAAALPFARRCAQALEHFGRPIYFLHGNRDFLLRDFAGLRLLAETCALSAFGQTVLLTHGDAQCLDDAGYQQLRVQVRSEGWQQAFLAKPLAERLELASQMRDASRRAQGAQAAMGLPFADPDARLCIEQLRQVSSQQMVHGHTHRPGRFELGEGCARWVLSDWDFEDPAQPRGDCLLWSPDGWQRRPAWD